MSVSNKIGSSILVLGKRLAGPRGTRHPSGVLTTLLNECLCLHIAERREGFEISRGNLRFRARVLGFQLVLGLGFCSASWGRKVESV
ncbi:hypothetical protein QJS04_geneDACA006648 [Acorus gramineus]|uniref:Uncharacterized protein n=1 Tax=Acorus gramineus TaxID=55184 RepID=A0AAV9A2R4_ACOGR|nr:hypothetical protein QJS04_geneDACA006648 [Acorus gramineus]